MSVHVFPAKEENRHNLDSACGDCACGPIIEWLDVKTELPYPDGPLVIHNCFEQENKDECRKALAGEEK